MSRLIVYGDVHGSFAELKKLRKKIAPKKNDIEVCVGDLITKGKEPIKVLDYLIKHDIKSVLGNHEDKLLRYLEHIKKSEKNPIKLEIDEKNIIESLTSKHITYLENLPVYMKYKEITILHGGVQNHMNLDKLSKREKQKVLRLRYVDKNKNFLSCAKEDKGSVFWAEVYNGKQGFIVYGHQKSYEVKKDKHAIGIDTGCVYGNKMSAAIFKDFKVDSLHVMSVESGSS